MRKLRDIDGELKALSEKTRRLKAIRLTQLGDLVVSTGADALPFEVLAGVLLEAAAGDPAGDATRIWRRRGDAFFRSRAAASPAADENKSEPEAVDRDDPPRGSGAGAGDR